MTMIAARSERITAASSYTSRSHAGGDDQYLIRRVSLFVLLLLDRSGLFWQQLAEREIRFAQSIDLGGFDTVANESQNGGTPFVPLRVVLANVLWQQRLVFRRFLGRAHLLALPTIGAALVFIDSLLQQPAQFLSNDRQHQALDHEVPPATTMTSSFRGHQ